VFFGLIAALLHKSCTNAPVAQWIEYCPPKAGVAGSIPAGRAKISNKFKRLQLNGCDAQFSYGICTEIILRCPTPATLYAARSPLGIPVKIGLRGSYFV
jgi:hypothetical protein